MRDMQKRIIEEMKVKPTIDPQEEIRISVGFLKNYLKAYPFLKGYVLGISGGQDSTLAGKLAQMAVDELNDELNSTDYIFVAVRLPYKTQLDEDDCQDALRFIKPSEIVTVNIGSAVDASVAAVSQALGLPVNDFDKGNVKARHRMEVQYHIAATKKLAVVGTDHSAEAVTGFYTKFGDGGADVVPIFRLHKGQGRQLLAELDCPAHLYSKTPTADLEDEKPLLADEDALGVSYVSLDAYLEGKTISERDALQIEELYVKSRHKRSMPITVFDDWWKKK